MKNKASVERNLVAWLAIPALLLASEGSGAAQQGAGVQIREWKVPYENSGARDPYVDAGGRVWFVGQRGHYLANLTPATGAFTRYDLEDQAGPHNLIVDEAGMVWYAGNRRAYIGMLNPETGEIAKHEMPDPAARDPHTLTFDSHGDIWFTSQGGNMIGKLETATGRIQLMPSLSPSSRPYGIKVDANDRPWIVLFGTNKLATVDRDTMTLREVELQNARTRPRRLEIDSSGNIWYVDYARGRLGMYDPAAETFEEWPTPGGESSRPYGMAIDAADRVWFVESGVDPNRFVGFDTTTKQFLGGTDVPSGGELCATCFITRRPTKSRLAPTRTTSAGQRFPEVSRSVRPRVVAAAALAIGLGAGRLGTAYLDGPPPSATGGFGEESCHQCHFDNEPNLPGGSLAIQGLPDGYVPGRRYPLTVTLAREGMSAAGFQLAARVVEGGVEGAEGRKAGVPQSMDERAKIVYVADKDAEYAQHTERGASLTGPAVASWQLEWTAPDRPGPVLVHVAGNAAKGDQSEFGDFIYTRELRIIPAVADPAPASSQSSPQ